jgi:hypothetical protein
VVEEAGTEMVVEMEAVEVATGRIKQKKLNTS